MAKYKLELEFFSNCKDSDLVIRQIEKTIDIALPNNCYYDIEVDNQTIICKKID